MSQKQLNRYSVISTLRQEKIFSNNFGATAMAVVEEFLSPDEIAAISLDELVSFLEQKSKNHLVDAKGIAEALKKAARSSYRLSKSLAEPVNACLASSTSVIKALQSRS